MSTTKAIEYKYIEKVMEAFDHVSRYVISDRSIVWDFLPSLEEKEREEFLDQLSRKLGFKVYRNTYIVDIAKEVKKIEEEAQAES